MAEMLSLTLHLSEGQSLESLVLRRTSLLTSLSEVVTAILSGVYKVTERMLLFSCN